MRILAAFCAAFAAGVFLAQYLLPEDWLLPCAFLAFGLACGGQLLPGDAGLVLTGTGLALALGWNWLFIRQVAAPARTLSGTEGEAVMTLCDFAVPTSYGARVTVKLAGVPGKAVYYADKALLDLRPGQSLRGPVRFQDAGRIREDEVTAFTSRGVFLLAYSRGTAEAEEGSAASWRWWPVRLGKAVRERIGTLLAGDRAAFVTAILTGDRSGLSVQASADLSEAGLTHVLAVSGMHCGFLLALVTLLTGRRRRRLLAAIAIPLLVFYALMTGGSPSVVRACVMLSLLVAAPLVHRAADGPTSLAFALFLILLKNPFAAASVSLQLSFGAMAGLLWVTPGLYRFLAGEGGRLRSFLAASISASVGALAFTAPLTAFYFGTLALIAPVSSLLCLWAAGGVFLLGLPAVAAAFLSPALGGLLAFAPGLLIRYILFAAHLLAKVPFHAVYFANPYLKYWLAYVYALFALARFPGKPKKYAVSAVLAVLTLALTLQLGKVRYGASLEAVVLDVGQGQSVLLSSRGTFALVDCGSANNWYAPGALAAAQLRSMGCRRLDKLILTHYDSDHVSGVEDLLCRLEVGELLLPDAEDGNGMQGVLLAAAKTHQTPVRFLREMESVSFGAGTLTVLAPVGESGDNERGLCVLASAGEADLLITGDMDQATERKLLASFQLPDLEALVVGHHGSRYSTSEELLSALTPETACISTGSNSYGHPAPETLRRLSAHGCAVYRTDRNGNIRLSLN